VPCSSGGDRGEVSGLDINFTCGGLGLVEKVTCFFGRLAVGCTVASESARYDVLDSRLDEASTLL